VRLSCIRNEDCGPELSIFHAKPFGAAARERIGDSLFEIGLPEKSEFETLIIFIKQCAKPAKRTSLPAGF
jgi:hypothetical protein